MKRKYVLGILGIIFTVAFVLSLIFVPKLLPDLKLVGIIVSISAIYLLIMTTLVIIFLRNRVSSRLSVEHSTTELDQQAESENTATLERKTLFTTKNITRTAILSAMSIVLYYYVKFPVPAIFPSFLDFQFSDLPALLAGFMMGPISGMAVIIIKFLVKLPASGTYGVGEVVDLLLGLSYVLTASLIYKRKHCLKGAIVALSLGSLVCVFMAAVLNRFVAVPLYIMLMFDGNWNILVGAMNKIFGGNVSKDNFYTYYIFLSVIPFNIIRCLITSILSFLTYKHLKKVMNRF